MKNVINFIELELIRQKAICSDYKYFMEQNINDGQYEELYYKKKKIVEEFEKALSILKEL